jgi:DNA-binding HxlR family transcriptional regulator
MKRTERRSDCPINFALQTFGDPWSLLVIRDLMFTERRTYSDFLRAEEGMATNVLAARLKHLQTVGLIRKRGTGRGADYALTAKGLDLLPTILQLVVWSARHDKRTAAPKRFVARINGERSQVESELREQLRMRYGIKS